MGYGLLVPEEDAKATLRLAAYKLPIKTKFIIGLPPVLLLGSSQ